MHWVLLLTRSVVCVHVGQMVGSPVATCEKQAPYCSSPGSNQVPSAAVKGAAQALAKGEQPSGATSSLATKHIQTLW